jgi:hypothetical protein
MPPTLFLHASMCGSIFFSATSGEIPCSLFVLTLSGVHTLTLHHNIPRQLSTVLKKNKPMFNYEPGTLKGVD